MVYRPVSVRKFLFPDPSKLSYLAWEVESYPNYLGASKGYDKDTYYLNISLGSGGRGGDFGMSISSEDKKSVAECLKPVNELIDQLIKATTEFAKACNTPQPTKKVEAKPKVEKSAKQSKK